MKTAKILSFFTCGIICISCSGALTGCNEENSSSKGETIAMEDLPYGTTLRDIKSTHIPIEFDGRYFSDEAMTALSNYFYAIQTQDIELFRSTQNPEYVSYLEANSGFTLESFMQSILTDDKINIGDDFEYSYIEVIDAGDNTDDSSINQTTELMDSLYEKAGKGSFRDTVKDAKFARLSITVDTEEKTFKNDSHIIYIFECEDGIYIFD